MQLQARRPLELPTSIGRYQLISELGRGAMARVYLALDPNIDRKIALKVLDPAGLVDADALRDLRTRFLLEARAAGNLRHPAAVAIYDADHDPDSGHSYIAMEWVDGESLDRQLKSQSPVPIPRAVEICREVAGALDAAHRQGLIHRDVKPANILLDRNGNAKLSDFGIAKFEALELTSTGQVLGTPYYMSPEQIGDQPLDGRSDLFSLGVVLYQCLTGSLPFSGTSLASISHKIVHIDPRPPQWINEEIPEPLAAVVARLLAKRPEERYQTGLEVLHALHQATAGDDDEGAAHATHPPQPHSGTRVLACDEQPDDPPAAAASDPPRRQLGLVVALAMVALLVFLLVVRGRDVRGPVPTNRAPGAAPIESARDPAPAAADPARVAGDASDQSESAGALRFPRSSGSDTAARSATLQVDFTNRLKRGSIAIRVDGKEAWSRPLKAPKGLLKRAAGQDVEASIPVAPGHHVIEVRIRGASGQSLANKHTGNLFDTGRTRRLRVEFIPPKYLHMIWKEDHDD